MDNNTISNHSASATGQPTPHFVVWIVFIEAYIEPALVWAGLAGHAVICTCLLASRLVYRCSGSVYLCAINITIVINLLTLFIKSFGSTTAIPSLCHLFTLLASASALLINLFMAGFIADRCSFFSTKWRPRLCKWSRACAVVIGMSVVSLAIHVNMSLTVGVSDDRQGRSKTCVPQHAPEYYDIKALVKADCIINHVIPNCILIGLIPLLLKRCCLFEAQSQSDSPPTRLRCITALLLTNHLALHLPKQIFKLVHVVRGLTDPDYGRMTETVMITNWVTNHLYIMSLFLPVVVIPCFHSALKRQFQTWVKACCRRGNLAAMESSHHTQREEGPEVKETLM